VGLGFTVANLLMNFDINYRCKSSRKTYYILMKLNLRRIPFKINICFSYLKSLENLKMIIHNLIKFYINFSVYFISLGVGSFQLCVLITFYGHSLKIS